CDFYDCAIATILKNLVVTLFLNKNIYFVLKHTGTQTAFTNFSFIERVEQDLSPNNGDKDSDVLYKKNSTILETHMTHLSSILRGLSRSHFETCFITHANEVF
ncbi:hypothetical protein ACJX0J_019959, partial [Zea mays]